MEGTVFDIRRFSTHDGGGIRTTVFLKGCPLSCVWCHNPEGIHAGISPMYFPKKCIGCLACCKLSVHGGMSAGQGSVCMDASKDEDWDTIIDCCPSGAISWDSRRMTVDAVVAEAMKDRPFYKYGGGVTISGGEPMAQADFLLCLLQALKAEGIHTAIETSLYAPTGVVNDILPWLDFVYADFKLYDDEAHKKYTGVSNQRIREHLQLLLHARKGHEVIIRTPLIPGITATEENIASISRFLSGICPEVSYELLNYNPLAEAKYHLVGREYGCEGGLERYTSEEMAHFADIARGNGIRHVIVEA